MRGLWVVALLSGLFVAGVSAGTLRADATTPADTTTTESTTTTATTSTDTTADTTTQAATTTVATTATVATTTPTAATTTTTTKTTAAPPKRKPATPVAQRRRGPCLLVGGVAVLEPGGPARVLGPVARGQGRRHTATGGIAYPAGGSVARVGSIDLHTSACGPKATGSAVVRSVSLFGGAITAQSVKLVVHGRGSGIAGLRIGGAAVAAAAGRRLPVGGWGYAVAFGDPSAEASVLAVHLLRAHAGLPAGSVVLVAFAGLPRSPAAPARAHPKRKPARRLSKATLSRRHEQHAEETGAPLTAIPPLGPSSYVFPVVGPSDYIDTYGAFRGDVPGNWHHGDDIFAPLGTPVVAVATGTLNRVGWEHLGGWRLWVRDRLGNEFYYAHLSGYSPLALRSRRVRAGDVIGFLGNTGDAFTTSPHLHFEVHPRRLLRLGYNGAVDPTRYLDHWRHLAEVRAPAPVHPGFPPGAVRQEASYVWRELLAARGITRHAPSPSERPKILLPSLLGGVDAAPLGVPSLALRSAAARGSGLPAPLVAALLALFGAALAGAVLLRRLRDEPDGADEPTIGEGVARLARVARSLRAREQSTRRRRR